MDDALVAWLDALGGVYSLDARALVDQGDSQVDESGEAD